MVWYGMVQYSMSLLRLSQTFLRSVNFLRDMSFFCEVRPDDTQSSLPSDLCKILGHTTYTWKEFSRCITCCMKTHLLLDPDPAPTIFI